MILGGTILLGGLLFLGLRYVARSLTHESTDDAFLDGDIISVAPKVSGQVSQVHVTSNQKVQANQLLVEIEPRDLAVQAEQKKAAMESSHANLKLIESSLGLFRAQIVTAQALAKQSDAEAVAAEATTAKANADLKRAEELMRKNTISPQEFDTAKTAAAAAEANLQAAREKTASDRSKIAEVEAQLRAGERGYERAEAQQRQSALDAQQAELNLSYARIPAPADGQVTRKAVEPGDYIQVGQRLMALVLGNLWVTANFKETQLKRIRPRQPVKITIDSMPDRVFAGYVESIQAGSGARFSLLPPENAVGNYVKIVQRVPVRIFFDGPIKSEHVLGPGMSVVPSVHVTNYDISELIIAMVAIVLAALFGLIWWRMANRRKPT